MIRVLYTCHECAVTKQEVNVREREDTEDVVAWVRDVMARAAADDHRVRSPQCHAREADLYIPTFDGTPIGAGRRH